MTLCKQQYDVLRLHLPSVQIRFLSGQDKPELWRNQSIWDDVLKNISVVVSTHDVLLGALSNGFVRIQSLALLVFDEGVQWEHFVHVAAVNRFQHITVGKSTRQTSSCSSSIILP